MGNLFHQCAFLSSPKFLWLVVPLVLRQKHREQPSIVFLLWCYSHSEGELGTHPIKVTAQRVSLPSHFPMQQQRCRCQWGQVLWPANGLCPILQGLLALQGSLCCFLSCWSLTLSDNYYFMSKDCRASCLDLPGETELPPSNSGLRGSGGGWKVLEFSVERHLGPAPVLPHPCPP